MIGEPLNILCVVPAPSPIARAQGCPVDGEYGSPFCGNDGLLAA